MEWYVALLLIAVLVVGGLGIHRTITAKPYMGKAEPKVFQEEMTRRHTAKRKAEDNLEKLEWERDFTKLDADIAIRNLPLDGLYVPSSVLTFLWDTDRPRFDILMAHNQRLEQEQNANLESEYYDDY